MAKKQTTRPKDEIEEKTSDSSEHPISVYLRQLIKDYEIKHADLVDGDRLHDRFGIDPSYALKVDQSYISRLLALKENDRPAIGLLSDLFCLLSEIAFAQTRKLPKPDDTTIIDIFESWSNFLSRRGNAVFYELARHLGKETDRLNPARFFLTRKDEIEWQRSHVPRERWIITDILAESMYPDFLEATCSFIQHKKLKRLIYFMPNSEKSESQFEKMRKKAEEKVTDFSEKVHCLLLKNLTSETAPLMRMRLDDPNDNRSPLRSGVLSMGSKHSPEVIALSEAAIMKTISWLQPKVRLVETLLEKKKLSLPPISIENEDFILFYPKV